MRHECTVTDLRPKARGFNPRKEPIERTPLQAIRLMVGNCNDSVAIQLHHNGHAIVTESTRSTVPNKDLSNWRATRNLKEIKTTVTTLQTAVRGDDAIQNLGCFAQAFEKCPFPSSSCKSREKRNFFCTPLTRLIYVYYSFVRQHVFVMDK